MKSFGRFRSLIIAVLAVAVPTCVEAQTYWRIPTTVGYVSAGAGVGILSIYDTSFDSPAFVVVPLVTTVGGAIFGYSVGKRADDALQRGEELSSRHRWAVRAGTVLTGATLGVIPAVLLIKSEDPSSPGSNEAIFVGSVVGGGVLAALLQVALEPKLRVSGASVRGGVGLSPSGSPAAVIRVAF